MIRTLLKAAGAAVLMLTPVATQAWDGAKHGKITRIDVTSGNNYAFRVYFDGQPICGTQVEWAYMNKGWDNFDATAALLTTAWAMERTVTVYTHKNGSYCQIGYVVFG